MTGSASEQSRRARGNGRDSPGSLLALSKQLFGRSSVLVAAVARRTLGAQPNPNRFIALSACRGR